MGRLSAPDIFGQARRVDKTWRDAADRVAPLTSCRRLVAENMVQKPAVPSASASQQPAASQSPTATQPHAATQPPAPETAESTAERVLPPAEWFGSNSFESCEGEQICQRLEGAVRWLDQLATKQETGRGGEDAPVGRGQGTVRVKCERLKSQLPVLRRLFAEKKLLPAATPRAIARDETSPTETSAIRAFGVRASSAEAKAPSAAALAAAQEAEDRRRTTGEHRWDGWAVFALVLALGFSEDRAFLCRWTMRGLGDTGGLPRSQIIELLCKMHQTLLPPGKVGMAEATAFQAASTVATVWDRRGSYRLRQDLRACIKAMESCFLRWAWCLYVHRAAAGSVGDLDPMMHMWRSLVSGCWPSCRVSYERCHRVKSDIETAVRRDNCCRRTSRIASAIVVSLRSHVDSHRPHVVSQNVSCLAGNHPDLCAPAFATPPYRLPWRATTQRDYGCSQSQSSASRHHVDLSDLTPEQQAVVNAGVFPGYLLRVVAFAGTGKTLCLRAWAQLRPYTRILYISVSKLTEGETIAIHVLGTARLFRPPCAPARHVLRTKVKASVPASRHQPFEAHQYARHATSRLPPLVQPTLRLLHLAQLQNEYPASPAFSGGLDNAARSM